MISDPTTGQTENVTVTLSALGNGTLTNLGSGTYDATKGVYSVTGTAAAVTTALDGLVFKPTVQQAAAGQAIPTTFTFKVTDTAGTSATDSTASVVTTETGATNTGLPGTLNVSQQLELIYTRISIGRPMAAALASGTDRTFRRRMPDRRRRSR